MTGSATLNLLLLLASAWIVANAVEAIFEEVGLFEQRRV
jgi:hypothetical protein